MEVIDRYVENLEKQLKKHKRPVRIENLATVLKQCIAPGTSRMVSFLDLRGAVIDYLDSALERRNLVFYRVRTGSDEGVYCCSVASARRWRELDHEIIMKRLREQFILKRFSTEWERE